MILSWKSAENLWNCKKSAKNCQNCGKFAKKAILWVIHIPPPTPPRTPLFTWAKNSILKAASDRRFSPHYNVLPGAVTGGETDRRRGTEQQSLIQNIIRSTRFGIKATANRNWNINPKTLTSFLMRWRHSQHANVILDMLLPMRSYQSGTFLRKIRRIFCRQVIDV